MTEPADYRGKDLWDKWILTFKPGIKYWEVRDGNSDGKITDEVMCPKWSESGGYND